MRLRLGIVAALMATTSGVALAQVSNFSTPAIPPASFYVGAFGGATFPVDSNISGPQVPSGSRASWDTGWLAGGTVGYIIGNGFRVELEGAYRRNSIDRMYGAGASGRISNITAMGNVIYDINTGTFITPYIGIGVGASYAQVRATPGAGAASTTSFSDHDVVLAYQGIAGVSFQVTPELALGVDYRFFGTMEPRFGSNLTPSSDHSFTNRQHTVTAGIRYLFGQVPPPPPPPEPVAPPPPPPPPAAVRPAQQAFIVFFDFNRSNLRPDAMATIQQAAQVILAGGSARMTLVTGHTDTVGSVQYNIGLSQRRAEAVRAALVQLGVPANVITARAMGKSQLLVPTPDQTREAQNRRAEIVVQ